MKLKTLILSGILGLALSWPGTATAELVGYWDFDSYEGATVYDVSGRGNNGTMIEGYNAGWGQIGKYGFGSGHRTSALVKHSGRLLAGDGLTLMSWVRFNDRVDHRSSLIVDKRTDYALHIRRRPGNVWFKISGVKPIYTGPGGDEKFYSRPVLGNNDYKWNHIAASYDGSTVSFYINGQLNISIPASGTPRDAGYDLTIGSNQGATVDETRIYNHGLSQSEIVAAMQENNFIGEFPVIEGVFDIVAEANEEVVLDASGSYDPDGEIIAYKWIRLPEYEEICYGGYDLLRETNGAGYSKCTYNVLGRAEEMILLEVTDNDGNTSSHSIFITNSAAGGKGVEGPKGDKGDPGSMGPVGPQGPKGDKGDPGDKGDDGADGAPGVVGPQGLQGDKGDKGDRGDQGDPGEDGLVGSGPQGPKGDAGPQGPEGDAGISPEELEELKKEIDELKTMLEIFPQLEALIKREENRQKRIEKRKKRKNKD